MADMDHEAAAQRPRWDDLTTIRRSLILLAVGSFLIMPEARAAGTATLGKHTTACQSYQDILDLSLNDQNNTFHEVVPSGAMWLKYITGACREYMSGTTVDVQKEQTFQGIIFQCIKIKGEDRCFWALNGDQPRP